MKDLLDAKERLLTNGLTSPQMRAAVESFGVESRRPLGKLNPWAWWVEITRGCNLRCAFCATRLLPEGPQHFMDEETWRALVSVVAEVTPYGRLELGQAGEPALHPQILDFLRIARELAPHVQLLTYTNGTTLVSGQLTYKQLFDAGLNAAFVDMYAPVRTHEKLARESGAYWFRQVDKPKDAPNIFTYQNDPEMRVIMLAQNPYDWQPSKRGRVGMSTFFNDLDWEAASAFGLEPVTQAPHRRCDLPSKFPTVNWDGTFLFCCFDYMRHSVDRFGNIKGGLDDFLAYWLGSYMQDTRRMLDAKDRERHAYCSKCAFTSIRCDIPYWKGGTDQAWNGTEWRELPEGMVAR